MTTKRGRGYTASDFEGAAWKTSTYSGGSEGQCVECANVTGAHTGIAVRDSKIPEGPALLFSIEAFSGFISAMHRDEFAQL